MVIYRIALQRNNGETKDHTSQPLTIVQANMGVFVLASTNLLGDAIAFPLVVNIYQRVLILFSTHSITCFPK